jgi:hypothetical protein
MAYRPHARLQALPALYSVARHEALRPVSLAPESGSLCEPRSVAVESF